MLFYMVYQNYINKFTALNILFCQALYSVIAICYNVLYAKLYEVIHN